MRMRLTKPTKTPRIVLSAPVGLRESTILKVDGKYAGEFDNWVDLEIVLNGRYSVSVGFFKRVLYSFVFVPLSIDMTLA